MIFSLLEDFHGVGYAGHLHIELPFLYQPIPHVGQIVSVPVQILMSVIVLAVASATEYAALTEFSRF